MQKLILAAVALFLVVTLGGCQSDGAEPADTDAAGLLKGYELYSWQMQGDWYFALVPGTNRLKTYDEISSVEVRLQGVEALESELDKVPGGQQVFWLADRVPNMAMPPAEIIDEIRAYCTERGIQLEIA